MDGYCTIALNYSLHAKPKLSTLFPFSLFFPSFPFSTFFPHLSAALAICACAQGFTREVKRFSLLVASFSSSFLLLILSNIRCRILSGCCSSNLEASISTSATKSFFYGYVCPCPLPATLHTRSTPSGSESIVNHFTGRVRCASRRPAVEWMPVGAHSLLNLLQRSLPTLAALPTRPSSILNCTTTLSIEPFQHPSIPLRLSSTFHHPLFNRLHRSHSCIHIAVCLLHRWRRLCDSCSKSASLILLTFGDAVFAPKQPQQKFSIRPVLTVLRLQFFSSPLSTRLFYRHIGSLMSQLSAR